MRLSSKLYSYSTEPIPTKFRNVFSEESMKGIPLKWIKSKWFAVERVTKISPVQDTVHLRVKLKARLMTHSQILPLGKFSAQCAHLTMLQSSFRKEQHNLRVKDLDHQDRQNFEAVNRLTSANVISLLDEFPDALGTKYYLLMMKNIINSYLKQDLSPLQRIEDAWFSLYFVWYWRKWILCNKTLGLVPSDHSRPYSSEPFCNYVPTLLYCYFNLLFKVHMVYSSIAIFYSYMK